MQEHQKYWDIMNKRRVLFRKLLRNEDRLVYSKPNKSVVKYKIQGQKISIPATVRTTKMEGEPTLFYLKAIMPGTVDQVRAVMSTWEHRTKWDKRMSSMDHETLYFDKATKEKMVITDNCSYPYIRGLISARQFTTLTHGKFLNSKTLEAVSETVEYGAFPEKKDHVVGWGSVCVRMSQMSSRRLSNKYEIPKITHNGKPLKWCKIECMAQIDIKGLVPSKIYKMAVPRAIKETYEVAREYMMSEVLGIEFKRL